MARLNGTQNMPLAYFAISTAPLSERSKRYKKIIIIKMRIIQRFDQSVETIRIPLL